ncbi:MULTISPECIES: hypothetical protein [Flammeovirga]|uniref:Uncharacterized protein n=1 Tax=Flammeovirga agarivorans TaxID=2726742 RepID=A0A7X8XVV5_9BACT|nr:MULTISPECIES: hypothetical protein [Flammeovirga]NLR91624.1 hypothetical protein [Flammeovirga agarivorans]
MIKQITLTITIVFTFSFVANAQYYYFPLDILFHRGDDTKSKVDIQLGDPLLTHSTQANKTKDEKNIEYNDAHVASASTKGRSTTLLSFFQLFTTSDKTRDRKKKQTTSIID